jgi:HD-like signal output (HDOD) protein
VTARPHVLFVDDEPRILGGLRRMLRPYRERWDMSFAEGGEAALATMRERACDVIVSDYRMPGMDGAQLLERVRRDHPGTARVILSGQTNEDNLLRIMVLAHEFLTKPASSEQLVGTVDRLIGVRTAAADFVDALPSPPAALAELVDALQAEDASPASVGAVIERDPAATAKVLRLVNSSAYTTGRTVSNVPQAVALLGLHTVRGLVLMHDLIRTFDVGRELPAGWMDRLTRHSVETSRLARQLADGTEWQSHAFTAALLHEVGQLVLASSRPAAFGAVLDAWPAGEQGLCAAEYEAFGVSHLEVGAQLLGRWGLPAPVIEAVGGHPESGCGGGVTGAAAAVTLAHHEVEAALGPVCGPCHGAPAGDDRLDPAVREVLSRWRERRRS